MAQPNFLSKAGDNPDEQDLLDAIQDETTQTENSQEENQGDGTETTTSSESTTDETKQDDGNGSIEESNQTAGEGEENKKEGDSAGESTETTDSGSGGKENDGSSTDGTGQKTNGQEEKPLIFGKFKTLEEADRGYSEAVKKLHEMAGEIKSLKEGRIKVPMSRGLNDVQKLNRYAMVRPNVPKYEAYLNKDGEIELQRYLTDTLNNFSLELQKSLLGGELAATLYGILADTIEDDAAQRISTERANAQTDEITNKIYEMFPVLKTNTELEDTLSSLIIGEKVRRAQIAQQKGEEVKEMTADDYYKLAANLIKSQPNIPTETTQETVESLKPTPTLNAGKPVQKSDMDDIIDGMSKSKNRGVLF